MPKGAKRLNPDLKLTKKQKQLIYGILLTDGWLELGKGNINALVGLQICDSNKVFITYFTNILSNFININLYPKLLLKNNPKMTKVFPQWVSRTQVHPEFTKLIALFGGSGSNKTVPKYSDLMEMMDWQVLAYIIICDGSYKALNSGQAMEIHIQSYSKNAQDRFCYVLYHKLGIRCWPSHYGYFKNSHIEQFHVSISGYNQPKLEKHCKPLMLPSSHYKIPAKSKKAFSIGNFNQNKSFIKWLKYMKTFKHLEDYS